MTRNENVIEEPMIPSLKPGAKPLTVDGPTIETARLILRPWCSGDIAANTAMLSDPGTARFITPDGVAITTEIGGWRKSLDDIAQFVFTDLPDSYAARTGRPDNVGVVGIAVFRERWQRPLPAPAPPVAAAPQAKAGASADRAMAMEAMPQRIGTAHGQRERAPVGQTTFERASSVPQQVSELRYDSVQALVAMGVLPRRYQAQTWPQPRAFPGGFVPDPRGR